MNKTYIGTVEDAGDGSGDGIITFPPEMIEELGWQEDQELNLDLTIVNDNKIIGLDANNKLKFLNEEKISVLEIDESANLGIGQTQLSIYRETK